MARNELIQAAWYRGTVTYKEVAAVMGLREWGGPMDAQIGKQVAEVATAISRNEHEANRPLLSAVLVRTADRRPGGGFYDLARTLGKLGGGSEEKFWDRERSAVYREWARR